MGVCQTKETQSDIEARAKAKAFSKALEKTMQNDQNDENKVHKLLLLGAGESGKSTLFKQMVNIYGTGFPESERIKTYLPIIHSNCITSIQSLAHYCIESGITVACGQEISTIMKYRHDQAITPEIATFIKTCWEDQGIQLAFENRAQFQLKDSAQFFLEKIEEIGEDGYIPNEQDVLRSRVKTTGIVENDFDIEGNKFKIFDVGGQRSERRKWIHCFENVTALLFVGVLSEYDQVLYEDNSTNRMEETLNLFENMVNSRWFSDMSCILFLNKMDLFEEKIKRVPLTSCPIFEGFDDSINTFDMGCQAIQEQFESRKKAEAESELYTHVTCATDTAMVSKVFDAVRDIVIRDALREAGLVD